jgi:hypothetical protein
LICVKQTAHNACALSHGAELLAHQVFLAWCKLMHKLQRRTACCFDMSALAKEYRRKAAVAEALAEAVQEEWAKAAYLEAAECWRRLAEQAEANNW